MRRDERETERKIIVLFHIDETQDELYKSNIVTPVNKLYIWEILNKVIRGSETIIRAKNMSEIGYLPSYDDVKYFAFKQEIAKLMYNNTSFEYMSGNIHDVCDTS